MKSEGGRISRRSFIKLLAAGAISSPISFIAIDRSELESILQRVELEDIIGEAEGGSEDYYTAKARAKEAAIKEACRREAEAVCSEFGEDSEACAEARRRCEAIRVKATHARKGKRYAMALDLSKCIGCRRCAYACVMENNVGRGLGIEWILVLEASREGAQELEDARADYREAPKDDKVYVPVACMHCEDPPCTKVCPVRATWKEEDGIVVIDYDICIGCKYCIVACPYNARKFNLAKPRVSVLDLNPNMHVLGNVPRPIHVTEKCTWCIQRTRDGGVPACVEVCPVGARAFGDLNDPESPIRRIIEEYGVLVLKPEAGTKPRFFYYFSGSPRPRR